MRRSSDKCMAKVLSSLVSVPGRSEVHLGIELSTDGADFIYSYLSDSQVLGLACLRVVLPVFSMPAGLFCVLYPSSLICRI